MHLSDLSSLPSKEIVRVWWALLYLPCFSSLGLEAVFWGIRILIRLLLCSSPWARILSLSCLPCAR